VLYQLCKALFFGGVVEQLGQEVASCVESGPNGDTVRLVYNHVTCYFYTFKNQLLQLEQLEG